MRYAEDKPSQVSSTYPLSTLLTLTRSLSITGSGFVVGKLSSTSYSQVIARVHEDLTFTTYCRYVALEKVTAGYRKRNPGIQEDVHFCYVYHLLPVIFSDVPAWPYS